MKYYINFTLVYQEKKSSTSTLQLFTPNNFAIIYKYLNFEVCKISPQGNLLKYLV